MQQWLHGDIENVELGCLKGTTRGNWNTRPVRSTLWRICSSFTSWDIKPRLVGEFFTESIFKQFNLAYNGISK